eukprot:GHVS01003692.1.p1 GENE.GHVS01003692.1~~GHVS01003692.1.p1  ORF type:complete len:115 (+),score=9.69 GHVS01003692.1:1-345(+)
MEQERERLKALSIVGKNEPAANKLFLKLANARLSTVITDISAACSELQMLKNMSTNEKLAKVQANLRGLSGSEVYKTEDVPATMFVTYCNAAQSTFSRILMAIGGMQTDMAAEA